MNNDNKDYYLAAPKVPLADPLDGLIPVAALSSEIQVEVVIGHYLRTGDSIQLRLNETPIGEIRIIKENEKPGEIISMYLSEQHMVADGVYTLGQQASYRENGVTEFSLTRSLLVDRSRPGSALLAPMIFANINFGGTLKGTIPGYAGMEPGDVIQTLCNDVEGPAHVVNAENLTERPVRIAFARDFLQGLNSELIRISYQVTDRAGNQSILALPVELTLQTSNDDN